MRYVITLAIILAQLSLSSQTYLLDPKASDIRWTGYGEVGNFSQKGTVDPKSGWIESVEGVITDGEVIIDMTTIRSKEKRLTKHLKDKDFFHVKKYNEARVVFEAMEGDILCAKLIMRGKSGLVRIPVSIQMQENNMVIKGTLTVDRTAYDIKYNSSAYFQDLGNYAIKHEMDMTFELRFIAKE